MKIKTKQELIAPAIKNFLAMYTSYSSPRAPFYTPERLAAVKALDPLTCTAEDVAAVLNSSWVDNRCIECEEDFEETIQIGHEPDYEARWVNVCKGCLGKALGMLSK